MLDLLLCALCLESLCLLTASLGLLIEFLLFNLLTLLLVDGFHKYTLVLEHITFAFHVQRVVQVFVNLLRIAVLLQQATKHTESAHPITAVGMRASLVPIRLPVPVWRPLRF